MATGSQRNRFISFEGGEGSGKSVQARRLAERLKRSGHDVVLTREPGGTPAAEALRALLVTGEPGRWQPETEVLLFAAARAEHLAGLIRPALARGQWVITDRFADSTRVYQGSVRGVSPAFVDALTVFIVAETWPTLTLVLDVDVDTGLSRAARRAGSETRFERFDRSFHERVRAAYGDLVAREPERCVRIDGSRDEEAVGQAIWAVVAARFALGS